MEQVQTGAGIVLNRAAKVIIRRALGEDLGRRGDITTRAVVPSDLRGEAVIVAKSAGVVAGQAVAAGVFEMLAGGRLGNLPRPPRPRKGKARPAVVYQALAKDGERVSPGREIARLAGSVWVILAGERTALNILGRCSGIATLTRAFVEAVEGTGVRITETRKTAPGLRYLDKAAVRVGGGVNHRFGLFDAFLVKENHIAAAGSAGEAVRRCRQFATRRGRFRIIVEARNFEEYLEILAERPDRILLDNMTPEELRRCAETPHVGVELEASGGVSLDNVRAYAETGVDFISVGGLTHSVRAMDVSLLLIGGG